MSEKTVNAEVLAEALRACLISPNVADSNFEAANVVDVIQNVAKSTSRLADAVTLLDHAGTAMTDGEGREVESLTEAMVSVSQGLTALTYAANRQADALDNLESIAHAIDNLAEAVRDHKNS